MKALIMDYYGVLDGPDEDKRQWKRLLSAARNNGIITAILSNSERETETQQIKAQWSEYFDNIFFSGEIGSAKPDSEAFEYVSQQLDIPVNECVMVDDNIFNIRAAVETGLVGVYYQHLDRVSVELGTLFNLESGKGRL